MVLGEELCVEMWVKRDTGIVVFLLSVWHDSVVRGMGDAPQRKLHQTESDIANLILPRWG